MTDTASTSPKKIEHGPNPPRTGDETALDKGTGRAVAALG
jgi:hypothetical protein